MIKTDIGGVSLKVQESGFSCHCIEGLDGYSERPGTLVSLVAPQERMGVDR